MDVGLGPTEYEMIFTAIGLMAAYFGVGRIEEPIKNYFGEKSKVTQYLPEGTQWNHIILVFLNLLLVEVFVENIYGLRKHLALTFKLCFPLFVTLGIAFLEIYL